eukprot:2015419-Prymnesium_polylepis.1
MARPDIGVHGEREDLTAVALLARRSAGVAHHLRRRRRQRPPQMAVARVVKDPRHLTGADAR